MAQPQRLAAERFLDRLIHSGQACSGRTRPGSVSFDATDVAVLVAHPDDETLGCGAQLVRLRGATLVVVTDGAPRDLSDARRLGLRSAREYAAHRASELEHALSIARADLDLVRLDVPDQQSTLELVGIVRRLVEELRRRGTRILLTHAYEGGHPDHDAAAFAAHACAAILAAQGLPLAVIEMPYYRAQGADIALQCFVPLEGHKQYEIALPPALCATKHRMILAHASQAAMLCAFQLVCERFRIAPHCSFDEPPNAGAILYERLPLGGGMNVARWLSMARNARRALRIHLPCQ